MKIRFIAFCVFFLFPVAMFAQWKTYTNADTTDLNLRKPQRINVWIYDIVNNTIMEKNNLVRMISMINFNQLDTTLFSFAIHVRTGISGPVCMDKESYLDKKRSVEVLGYNYPVILIDTFFKSKMIAGLIKETLNTEEVKLLKPLPNTSVLRIDGKNATINYNFLLSFLSQIYESNKPVAYHAHYLALSFSPYNKLLPNINLSDRTTEGAGWNYSLGMDYEYRGEALNRAALNHKKKPWLGLGVGLHYSNAILNNQVSLRKDVKDSLLDVDEQEFRLLVEARDVNERVNVRSISVPVFISFSFLKNRNLNLKVGAEFAWLFGNLHSNGAFTYKGVYYLNTIYQDTLDDRYSGIAEKYGYYSNYPLTYSGKLSQAGVLKNLNVSLLAEVTYKIKIAEHIDFLFGATARYGLSELLRHKSPADYVISTHINDYNSLLLKNYSIKLNVISVKAGLTFSF